VIARIRSHLDLPLLTALLLLVMVSLVVLYSAGGRDAGLLLRQGLRIVVSAAVLIGVAQLPPATLRRWAPYLYAAGLLLLLAVMGLGTIGKGARRWLDLGVVRFQPAEIMKIAVPMAVAWWCAREPLPPALRTLLVAAALLAVPALLVVLQPDLGTALLIAASGVFVVFLAGVRWRIIVGLVVVAVAAAPMLWTRLHDYQKSRILTLFNPWDDPLGRGYHVIQSTIAVGSGGVFGKGWLNGSQSQLEFIPERATDFIFAVYSEEFGLLGSALLLSIYMVVILRSLYIAGMARDGFSRLLAGSLALTTFCYVFVNMGMVSGILPVVGVPLPLVSYGGTSMITLAAGFGILMSIHTHRRLMVQ